jgi:hypothetical protein
VDPDSGFTFDDEPKQPKKSTFIDEDLRAKFFAHEENKSEVNSDDDWQLEDDEFHFM